MKFDLIRHLPERVVLPVPLLGYPRPNFRHHIPYMEGYHLKRFLVTMLQIYLLKKLLLGPKMSLKLLFNYKSYK